MNRNKKYALADKLAKLTQAEDNDFADPEEVDFESSAKVVEEFEDEETQPDTRKSSLRAKNIILLQDVDTRYAGSKISRKSLDKDNGFLGVQKASRRLQKSISESSDDGADSESDENNESDEEEMSNNSDTSNQLENKVTLEENSEEEGSDNDSLNVDEESDSLGDGDSSNLSNNNDSDEEGHDDVGENSEDGYNDVELHTLSETDKNAEIDKGKATQNQLRIWDALLEVRIRLQKMLIEANKLPQTSKFHDIALASASQDDESLQYEPAVENSRRAIAVLVDNLIELQDEMMKQNSETQHIRSGKRKAETRIDSEKGEIASDEEITSSEDEKDDEDEIADADNTDEEATIEKSLPKPKRLKLNDYEKIISDNFTVFTQFRNDTIQKWNDKTQVASGKLNKKNLSALQISTLKQVEQVLSDKSRLVKRTQMKRSNYEVIGKVKLETEGELETEYDEEIFDDDDFYHQLLRELIERKTTNVNDPVQLSRHWLELQKLRTKMKRKVDTKASKGRKLRYEVHPKLVNFMAPNDDCPMSENAIKELMSSLFGKLQSCK